MNYRRYEFPRTIIYYDDNYVEVSLDLEAVKIRSKRGKKKMIISAGYEKKTIFLSKEKEFFLPLESLKDFILYLAEDDYFFSEKNLLFRSEEIIIEKKRFYLTKEIPYSLLIFVLLFLFLFQNGNLSNSL